MKCITCHREKPIKNFSISKKDSQGNVISRLKYCGSCQYEKNRQKYALNHMEGFSPSSQKWLTTRF